MEFVFFGAFALVAAMIFNVINPKVMAMSWAQAQNMQGFIGRTLVTGAAFFVVLFAAGFLMKLVLNRAPHVPAVG